MSTQRAEQPERAELHELVNELPDEELVPALRFLTFLLSELPDDFVTEDDRVAIREGWADYRAGRVRPLQELRDELEGG